jgi:hypothetical protein
MKTKTKTKTKVDKMTWAGRIVTVLAALPFCVSGVMKLTANPAMVEGMGHAGWSDSLILCLAILELSSVVLYLIPQIAILGGILLTGYIGGAIATHVRIGEAPTVQVIIGLLIWLGLYLRDARLREILPIRKSI